jgi:hypothetical protein
MAIYPRDTNLKIMNSSPLVSHLDCGCGNSIEVMFINVLFHFRNVRMSAFDITVLQYFTACGLPVLTILSFILLIGRNLSLLRSRLLSRLISSFDASYESCLVDYKKTLFLPLHDIVSSDWKLRNKGCIRIVEIGFRTG